jgi:hypothetical protein
VTCTVVIARDRENLPFPAVYPSLQTLGDAVTTKG